ncbi:MAG: nucleoside deaminase [Gammaproteobacteria bacterium]
MSTTDTAVVASGRQRLAALPPLGGEFERWRRFFAAYRPRPEYPDDGYVWLTGILALTAVASGNFGVGSILVNAAGDILVQGHNEVFKPYFRSDRHAEMVVMNRFEKSYPQLTDLSGYTLYTSLEPCPMCLVRLSTCKISKVLHAAGDATGGMVHQMHRLPPFWHDLARSKNFMQAQCCEELIVAAEQILLLNLAELMANIRHPPASGGP